MTKNIDEKIKELLKENDDIVVPKKISNGIDETLKSITNRKRNKIKRIATIACIISAIVIPIGVTAYKKSQQVYIPSIGTTINSDQIIYSLKKPITKKVSGLTVTLKDILYDESNEIISVSIEGNGNFPSNKSILKIGNHKLKSKESYISEADSIKTNAYWDGTYYFKYNKAYQGEDLNFKLKLDNKKEAEFNCKLTEGKAINNIEDLGPTSKDKGIEITAVVEEEKNKLDVTLLNNELEEIAFINYGQNPNENLKYFGADEGILILEDAKGNISKGKIDVNKDNNNYNRFTFDTTNLVKPFTIKIPELQVTISTIGENKGLISSETLELPIPVDNEEIKLNENINLQTNNKLFKDSDNEVNILSIKRNNEECTVVLEYPNKDDKAVNLLECLIIPSMKGMEWFEGGLSTTVNSDDTREITFKIPDINSDKIFVKIIGSDYKIKGDWDIVIE